MSDDRLAIETRELTRAFGERVAVDHLNLQVPRGSIFGFLGPNGAGKTTTIRMLLGLTRPTSGEVRLHGQTFTRDRRDMLRGIGALVESPSLYPHLTGEENLEVTRHLVDAPRRRVGEVLDQFDLSKDAKRLVRTYSSGMKQLLGLALACLARPSLLILDEPTNSLDPTATRKLRALLRRLATDEGATIFLSSHVLAEVERIVDRLGVIHRGRLLFQGDFAALKSAGSGSLEDVFIELIEASDKVDA